MDIPPLGALLSFMWRLSASNTRVGSKVLIVTRDLVGKLWLSKFERPADSMRSFLQRASTRGRDRSVNRRFEPREDGIREDYIPYTRQDGGYITLVLRSRRDPVLLVQPIR